MAAQPGNQSAYQRPWSVVPDEELRLLRELERTVSFQGGVTAEVHSILGRLKQLRGTHPKQGVG